MSDLELTLPSRVLELAFDTYIDVFPRRFFDADSFEYVVYDDESPKTEYLNFKNSGLSVIFEGILLKGVFMYINDDGYTKFGKACTYLDEAFWHAPTQEKFEKILLGHKFSTGKSGSKFLLSMNKDNVVFSYMDSPNASYIYFGQRGPY